MPNDSSLTSTALVEVEKGLRNDVIMGSCIQFKNKLFRTHLDCVNLYPIDNKGEDADTDTDAVAYEMLRSVESRSPSRFENQRVGCILIRNRDGFRVMNATNTFNNNVGVHAELNAISQFLKILPLSSDPLQMVVTFSPCIDCAQLIRFLGDITNVSYCFKYDEGGIDILQSAGINVKALEIKREQSRPKSLKLHSYSKILWEPNVTSIFITSTIQDSKKEGEDSRIVLSHSDSDGKAFDVRPFVIEAFKNRTSVLEILTLSYKGSLNHREKLFSEICGCINQRL